MILGITGRIASGKGVAAQYFHEHGYNYYTLSTEVREEASRRQLPITREQLQYLGNDLREKEGPDIWMKKIYENQDFSRNSIIDGLRNPAEIEYLKNLSVKFYLCSVDAHVWIRYQRVLSRNKLSDPKTYFEFVAIDSRDYGIGEPSWGQQVRLCMQMADSHLLNESKLDAFVSNLADLYKQLNQ